MKKFILNIISILLMLTGPFLMILPGPQVISWLGLALFLYTNRKWFKKFKWYNKLENKCITKIGKSKYYSFDRKECYYARQN